MAKSDSQINKRGGNGMITKTEALLEEVEQTDDNRYKLDYTSRLLAKSILSLLPDEVIQFAVWQVYRIGTAPSRKVYRKLAKFRGSELAKTLYYLWRGKEYGPGTLVEPKPKPYHYNYPCITIRDGELEIALTESFTSDNPQVEADLW